MYNQTIHSLLKSSIDHIARSGKMFGYSDNVPIGLSKEKQVYTAMTSGEIYSKGFDKGNDPQPTQWKSFMSFLGITNVTVIRAEGLKIPSVMETAMINAKAGINTV